MSTEPGRKTGPRNAAQQGIALLEVVRMFPDEVAARAGLSSNAGRQTSLPTVRGRGHNPDSQREARVLPVSGLQELLLRVEGDHVGAIEVPLQKWTYALH